MIARILPGLLVALLAGPIAAQQEAPGVHFLDQWDADGDGTVTLEEAREKRADIFYMFDADEDGTLTGAEYDSFDATRAADMASQGPGHGMGPADQAMARRFTDLDGDGTVTEAEFLAGTEAWLARMDRDADGRVTVGDFDFGVMRGQGRGPGAQGRGQGQGAGGPRQGG